MARHGRPPSPAPATRPVGFSPATGHATFFPCPPATPRRTTASPTNGFSRITRHETRITAFFPPDNESLPRDNEFLPLEYGFFRIFTVLLPHNSPQFPTIRRNSSDTDRAAVRAQSAPATRPVGFSRITRQETRNLFFPCPPATPRRATASPANGFSRITRHETRITAFFRITSSLYTISHHFPRFPGISRPPPPPSAVLARLPGARRQPQLPPPSGLVPLRPRHNEPMLRKENILDCANSGTFYLALAIARLESPLRSRHHREQRRSGTVRGVTRTTTGRGLRRRDMPSGQETISKRR